MTYHQDEWDIVGGHIRISHGQMPITGVDWFMLAGLDPMKSLDENLEPHFLNGIEAPGFDGNVEFYIMRSSLRLHTDDVLYRDMRVMGLILDCDSDLMLTTGRNDVPARPGDVYELHPSRRHGTKTDGFLAFAAYDHQNGHQPSPDAFRKQVLDELRRLLAFKHIRYDKPESTEA